MNKSRVLLNCVFPGIVEVGGWSCDIVTSARDISWRVVTPRMTRGPGHRANWHITGRNFFISYVRCMQLSSSDSLFSVSFFILLFSISSWWLLASHNRNMWQDIFISGIRDLNLNMKCFNNTWNGNSDLLEMSYRVQILQHCNSIHLNRIKIYLSRLPSYGWGFPRVTSKTYSSLTLV